MRQSGFTLIETLLYVFILSFILSGTLGAAYAIIENSDRMSQKVAATEDANFILRKLDWALTGASALSFPAPGSLMVTRFGAPMIVQFQRSGTDLQIKKAASWVTLNSASSTVASVSFTHLTAPEGVYASLYINGTQFVLTKYLRQ